MKISKKEIALIHVAKSQLGLSEDEYRDLLRSVAGVESSRDLTPPGLQKLLARFKEMGFKLTVKPRPARATHRDPDALPSPPQSQKIAELYAALGWTSEGQIKFNKRQCGVAWPQTRAEANKVIEGLKSILARGQEKEVK
jgi:hypothetical protein